MKLKAIAKQAQGQEFNPQFRQKTKSNNDNLTKKQSESLIFKFLLQSSCHELSQADIACNSFLIMGSNQGP